MGEIKEIYIPRLKRRFTRGDLIHFIGIGGIGMSGLARILLEAGFRVSGSDLKQSTITDRLIESGAEVTIGHQEETLKKGPSLVVRTSCISGDNPENMAAKKGRLPIVHRAELLASMLHNDEAIAVTGAHGKTTTAAMIALILKDARRDPTFALGAEIPDLGTNARLGKGEQFVAEADESDGSFEFMDPDYMVFTNIDSEHLDYYKDLDGVIAFFQKFIGAHEQSIFAYNGDDANLATLAKELDMRGESFGLSEGSDLHAVDIKFKGLGSSFKCFYMGRLLGTVKLGIPGQFNIYNGLAAILIAVQLGIDFEDIKKSLYRFKGAQRRFEIKGEYNDIVVVEDYAHHPTEIQVTLDAARRWWHGEIIAVFQPHRFSRTRDMADKFAKSFKEADRVILADIYSAFEEPIPGVSTRSIYEKMDPPLKENTELLPKDRILSRLADILKPGTLLLVLGAGDIGELSTDIVKGLKDKKF
ncbi:MAG: UDP-N-acetylmuramate--L-alanine ligase [Candidatus Omnitrophica bacterium]|nr:UDP-N-acetylmuramate--L-alanine ligase [Candidatus Omnitrophota bacterium]